MDRVVETGRCKSDTDCQEGIHLVCLLLELVVDCGAVLELFCARDEEENVGKGFCGIRVAAEHHVCETDVVVRLIMAGGDSDEHCLKVSQVQRPRTFLLSSMLSIILRARVKSPRRQWTRSNPMMEKYPSVR